MQSEILLNSLSKNVTEIQQIVHNQFENLSSDLLNRKENHDSWSIAECLEHLNIYARYYLPVIEKQLKTAPKNKENASRETKPTWLGNYSVNSIDPSNVKKQKTLKHLNPTNSKIEADVVNRFLNHQEKLLTLINQARLANLNELKVPVEFFRLLKINLGDCFRFLIAHERRHIQQAINAKNRALGTERVNR